MKQELALRLLSDLMDWDVKKATEEFKWLKLLVEYKYDHYQGYSPGARFLINLINWLKQFPEIKEREVAYKFILQRLIFISQREMHHLVNLSMPIFDSEARRLVAKELKLKFYETWGDSNADKRLRLLKLRTLYVALSDGAHIDVFRRDSDASNEQVVPLAEISPQKWKSLSEKLKERLDAEGYSEESPLFERICLIDDFTGSGFTLVRFDNEKNRWDGKVPKFCNQCKTNEILGNHVIENCTVHVHHYLASTQAKEAIHQEIDKYAQTSEDFSLLPTFSYVLPPNIVVSGNDEYELANLLTDFYDHSIESKHSGKNIWYGYKQCGLPLVLDHNTPNNSIALLWAKSKSKDGSESLIKMQPLFPRKERHIDHGKK